MLFPSPIFIFLFLPLVLLGYFLIFKKFKNLFLLLASLFFYAWGEGQYILVLLGIILLNYIIGLAILYLPKYKLIWTSLGVIGNVGALVYFKYLLFLITNLVSPLSHFGIHLSTNVSVHMPLGISFITFHALSYIWDVHRGKIKAETRWFNLALYMCLFPHLIAGPIVRYADIGHQIDQRVMNLETFTIGIKRFCLGLGKKVIIANNMALIADGIFKLLPQQLTTDILWLGLIAYALQIFFDFSGYSDMAIGLAQMFGFKFNENFNYPYIARSTQEFWRRWHMTLASWFRDYIYIPLGGNRHGQIRTVINIMIVFTLTGVWHGASWHFIFWGLYYGVFLSLENLFLGKLLTSVWRPISHFYALMVITIGWLFFRVESLQYALFLLKMLFGKGGAASPTYNIWIFLTPEVVIIMLVALLASTPFFRWISDQFKPFKSSYALLSIVIITGILFYSLLQLASDTYNPFIYFRF